MRYCLCAALLFGMLAAQEATVNTPAVHHEGIFIVNGIDYHFVSGTKCTVVVAAHSVINRKFLGVKVRIVNSGEQSVTVKPDEVMVEDAVASHPLEAISGTALAKKISKPYNWARFAAKAVGGTSEPDADETGTDPEHSEMLKMMRQMASQYGNAPVSRSALATTEVPGGIGSGSTFSDEVSYLRRQEAAHPDVLMQLQKQNTPDYIEQSSLLANTIPPRADLEGVMFYPMGRLVRDPTAGKNRAQSHLVRVTVPVAGETFQFLLAVE